MKKFSFILSASLCLMFFISCEKEEDTKKGDDPTDPTAYECESCPDTPLAKASFDNNSGGIYKGVVLGSSGTILFNINNDGTEITAVMTLDGETINLASSVAWVDGEPYVAPFTGTYSGGSLSITFSVEATGGDPSVVSSDIPGHPNAIFIIEKETSTSLIEGFEGTYHTTEPEDGTFNILLSRDLGLWGGTRRVDGTNDIDDISGTITSNNILILKEGGFEVGVLEGDEINGEFVDGENTVTVHAERTL